MSIKWKYKVELSTENAFEKVEKKLSTPIPEELKILIQEANGASPDKKNIKIKGVERVFGSVLSFNENEQEADDIYTALLSIQNKKLIPFGIDPFGYIDMNIFLINPNVFLGS